MVRKILFAAVLAVMAAGCAKKPIVKLQQPAPQPQVSRETDVEPPVRSGAWQPRAQLQTVYFDYDSAELNADAREKLKRNAGYLKDNSGYDILVEGNCDERGTAEYNLVLGQKRASAVRIYYGRLGIPLKRIATISYGKEKPADPRNTEEAWSRNRRAETKVKAAK